MPSPPSDVVEEEQKLWPPPEEGASRLPNTGSASAYPCAEDIIARFVEFGKIGEKPRRGAESFRPPALSVSCADSSPTGGAKLGLSGPHRPLPPPLGEVPPQGAERDSVPPSPKPSPGGRWHGAAVTDEGKAIDI